MARKWKSGDLVKLKSGGPTMTVDAYVVPEYTKRNTDVVHCVWFPETKDGYGNVMTYGPQTCQLDEDALTEATPTPVVVNDTNEKVML